MNVFVSPRTRDRYLFIGAAVGIALVVFAGFARSYFLRPWFHHDPLPLLVHVHGVVMSSWIVLFLAQAFLIEKGRVDLHRRLGMLGAALACLMIVLGMVVLSQAAAREVHAHSEQAHFFLLLLLADPFVLLVFGALVAGAIAARHRRSDIHKRLMLLATISLTPVAISRLPFLSVAGVFIAYAACLLAPAIVDTVRHRRLHPVFGWGVPLLFVGLLAAYMVASTPAWQHFAERLVS